MKIGQPLNEVATPQTQSLYVVRKSGSSPSRRLRLKDTGHQWEENHPLRAVSMYPSIELAVYAMLLDGVPDTDQSKPRFDVFCVKANEKALVLTSSQLTELGLSDRSHVTKENYLLQTVFAQRLNKIAVEVLPDENSVTYYPFNDWSRSNKTLKTRCYRWKTVRNAPDT